MGGRGSGRYPEGADDEHVPSRAHPRTPLRHRPRFEPVRFTAYLLDGTMRFDRHGGLMVTFISPEDDADGALEMRQFMRVAVPLSVTVETLADWQARRDAQAERREATG